MKIWRITIVQLLFIALLTCESTENPDIIKFEKTLGKKHSRSLNIALSKFEKQLLIAYPTKNLAESYNEFIADLSKLKEKDSLLVIDPEFGSNLNDFLEKRKFDQEVIIKDHKSNTYDYNYYGNYHRAIEAVQSSGTFLTEYYNAKEIGGILSQSIFVEYLNSNDIDFNDYFKRRILLIELIY